MKSSRVSLYIQGLLIAGILAPSMVRGGSPYFLPQADDPKGIKLLFSRKVQKQILLSPVFTGVVGSIFAATSMSHLIEPSETLDNVAGDATVKFVRDTLREAGYTDEQIKLTRILSGRPFQATRRTIFVPFNDEQLLRARRYYTTKDDAEGKDIARAYMRKLRENKMFDVMDDEGLYAIFHLMGKVVTSDSIPVWRALIVHEMGHIVHSHILKRFRLRVTVGAFLSAYIASSGVRCTHPMMALPLALIPTILFDLFTNPLWRLQERQADEEVVKRTQNTEQLECIGRLFELLSQQNKIKSWAIRLMYALDSHPSNEERARMFMKARDQIEQMPEAA